MTIPIELFENHILQHCTIEDIWSFSKIGKHYHLFYSEKIWELKCQQKHIPLTCNNYMDQYVGINVPLIQDGDCIRHIRVNVDTGKIFPLIPHLVILINYKGNPQRYIMSNSTIRTLKLCSPCNNIVDKAVIVGKEIQEEVNDYIEQSQHEILRFDKDGNSQTDRLSNIMNQAVEDVLMSSKSSIPIYGYTVEYISRGCPTQFNILENVALLPKVRPLKSIDSEKNNILDKLINGAIHFKLPYVTKIHSLDSILRYFISEDDILLLTTEEKQERIIGELTSIHHILPSRLAFGTPDERYIS